MRRFERVLLGCAREPAAAADGMSASSGTGGAAASSSSSAPGSSSSGGAGRGMCLQLVSPLPVGQRCACGQPYEARKVPVMTTVYGPDTIFPVRAQQLYELHSGCCACRGCVVAYNGVQDRLFRYSSRSFLSLRHLYNFVDQLIGSGINVEAYVNSQRL
ncbi:hypothetical protein CHLRE_12g507007v5 [Chlamydomonas reinhardtii]|uniref:Uncharacterized protein n=1 Tax=Chlamydomonas reinhardtii TaxID=3055 RepID=A0A2K3D2X6_CHLRE|nr:uncharacterized protein CHLRE_12g507007v5 [Chlamydomonas reinhardtii]PNW74869.1 hypothetical protein CHLRE_12g507007v5 [Chlamydomonas reinhardtii]